MNIASVCHAGYRNTKPQAVVSKQPGSVTIPLLANSLEFESMFFKNVKFMLLVFAVVVQALPAIFAQRQPDKDYLVYVVCESADKIALVRFGAKGAKVEREIPTGLMPNDLDGP